MGVLWALAVKDLRLFVRDRVALFWALAFPLVFALFFGSLFGGDDGTRGKIALVVVDEAKTEGSASFVERLGASDALDVDTATDLESATSLVRGGKRVAYLRIEESFEGGAFALFGGGDEPSIELGVDPARSAEKGILEGLVMQSLFSGLATQMGDPAAMSAQMDAARDGLATSDLDPAQREALGSLFDALDDFSKQAGATSLAPETGLGQSMVRTAEVGVSRKGKPQSPFQITFPAAMVWGLSGCATTFASSLVRERTAGTLLRLRVAPLHAAMLLAGKGLACFLAGIAISLVLLAIGVVALGVSVGSVLPLLLALPAAALCFTGIMLVLSVIGKTEAAVAGGGWVLMLPLAMAGGGMIPLIAMPSWMLTVSYVSPFRWAILAIEGGIWRDFSLAEVATPVAILLGLAMVLIAIGTTIYQRRGA